METHLAQIAVHMPAPWLPIIFVLGDCLPRGPESCVHIAYFLYRIFPSARRGSHPCRPQSSAKGVAGSPHHGADCFPVRRVSPREDMAQKTVAVATVRRATCPAKRQWLVTRAESHLGTFAASLTLSRQRAMRRKSSGIVSVARGQRLSARRAIHNCSVRTAASSRFDQRLVAAQQLRTRYTAKWSVLNFWAACPLANQNLLRK